MLRVRMIDDREERFQYIAGQYDGIGGKAKTFIR